MTKAINQYNFLKVRLIGPAFLTNALLFGLNNSQSIYHVRACRKANQPTDIGLTAYCTKIRPLLEYAAPIWGGLPGYLKDDLERVQN